MPMDLLLHGHIYLSMILLAPLYFYEEGVLINTYYPLLNLMGGMAIIIGILFMIAFSITRILLNRRP
jgi:hypothetical protein